MKFATLSICTFVLFFQSIAGEADQLTCYKCGTDGICKDENINHG